MKINMKKWKKDFYNSEKKSLPILTYPGLPLINKTIKDVVTDGFSQFQLIKAVAERYPTAASVGIMDLSVEAEAFGSEIRFSEHDVPSVHGRLVTDAESIQALPVPSVTKGRMPEFVRACALSTKTIDLPVFGGVIGPFSLAGRLFGMSEIMSTMRRSSASIHLLLAKCEDLISEYALEYKKAGVHGIIMAEPAAGLLSETLCHNFSSMYVKRIIDKVQDDNFHVILHNCGQTYHLVESMLSTGAEGFHFGNAIDIADILPKIPKDKLVFGNIDPVNVLKNGSVYLVRKTTSDLLEKSMLYPNFVLSSGCDIPPGTPLNNINALFETVALYNEHMTLQFRIG